MECFSHLILFCRNLVFFAGGGGGPGFAVRPGPDEKKFGPESYCDNHFKKLATQQAYIQADLHLFSLILPLFAHTAPKTFTKTFTIVEYLSIYQLQQFSAMSYDWDICVHRLRKAFHDNSRASELLWR